MPLFPQRWLFPSPNKYNIIFLNGLFIFPSQKLQITDLLPEDHLTLLHNYVVVPLATTLFLQAIELFKGCVRLFLRNSSSPQGDLCSFLLESLRALSYSPPGLKPTLTSDQRFKDLLEMRWKHIEVTFVGVVGKELERLEHELLYQCFRRCFCMLQTKLSSLNKGPHHYAAPDQPSEPQQFLKSLRTMMPLVVDEAFLFCEQPPSTSTANPHITDNSSPLFCFVLLFFPVSHQFDKFCFNNWVPAVEKCYHSHLRHLSLAEVENAQTLGLHVSNLVTSAEMTFCTEMKERLEAGKK